MKGFNEVRSKIGKLDSSLLDAGKKGVVEAGDEILQESQAIVPVDTGELQASGIMEQSGGATNITVTVSYTKDYALYVHEALSDYHSQGTAKYLENPFTKWSAQLPELIMKNLKGIL